MKILVVTLPAQVAGMGHTVRCRELTRTAHEEGHNVASYSPAADWLNTMGKPPAQVLESARAELTGMIDGSSWRGAFRHGDKLDWVILDLPFSPADWVIGTAHNAGAKVCLLNGVGHDPQNGRTDLVIGQGFVEGVEYAGLEYVILRRELFTYVPWGGTRWFVWGGYNDPMGLLPMFGSAMRGTSAWLVEGSRKSTGHKFDDLSLHHRVVESTGNQVFRFMAGAPAACVAMGMICWELSTLRIPQYVFSATEGHLAFAKRMEDAGLVRAWDGIGLPEFAVFREFLSEPFQPTGERPDGNGARRVLGLMESIT